MVIVPGIVAVPAQLPHRLGGEAEDEDVVLPHGVADLDVGAVQGADGQRAVEGQLHVAGARGLGAGGGDLRREFGSRNDVAGSGDVIVGYEDHLEALAHCGIVVDDVRHVVDELDDQLGDGIAGRRLAGEDHGARDSGLAPAAAQAVVEGDHVKQVEQLALVFVNALDMDVEHGLPIDLDAQVLVDEGGQALFVVLLDGAEGAAEGSVVRQRGKALQLVQIGDPVLADVFADQCRQPGIDMMQPAPRGDAVGLVDDLAGIEAVEIGEDGLLHQMSMKLGHAVDLVAADDGQVGHAHPRLAFVVDDGEAAQQVGIAGMVVHHVLEETPVDLIDDLQVARQDLLQQVHRPGLKGLGHQGVVGIGEGAVGNGPGLLPTQLFLIQQDAHQFGDGDGGMGVIELDGHFIRQLVEIRVIFSEAVEDVAQRGADEEILLLEAQLLAHAGGVVGIEYLGDVLRLGFRLHRLDVVALVEILEIEVPRRLGRPQAHVVHGVAAEAGNGGVVGHGDHLVGVDPVIMETPRIVGIFHHPAVELDGIDYLCTGEFPGIAIAQPVVRVLHLAAVLQALGEHAILIANAVTVTGNAQGGHGVQEAGRQPAQAAIAQGGIGLHFADLFQIETGVMEGAGHFVVDSHVEQAVHEGAADEEFH